MEITVSFAVLTTQEFLDFYNRKGNKREEF